MSVSFISTLDFLFLCIYTRLLLIKWRHWSFLCLLLLEELESELKREAVAPFWWAQRTQTERHVNTREGSKAAWTHVEAAQRHASAVLSNQSPDNALNLYLSLLKNSLHCRLRTTTRFFPSLLWNGQCPPEVRSEFWRCYHLDRVPSDILII